ncbi:MAG: hypothetical protein DME30_02110 [Verrucomicrobia bacterium]|nr:MAG: hypothetical protein DME30_02110 [Verrucomicrobiota bacterium]
MQPNTIPDSAARSDQNSEQLKIIRRWHLSLRQTTLHFSCTAAAPQTGHLISFLSSIAVVDRDAA